MWAVTVKLFEKGTYIPVPTGSRNEPLVWPLARLTHLDNVSAIGVRLDLAELNRSQYASAFSAGKFQPEEEVDNHDNNDK